MKRLLASLAILTVLFAAVVALVAAYATNRPEGPTERWLAAISRDTDTGAIAKYGATEAAAAVLGFEISGGGTTDRKHLDRFEIGPATVSGDTATVPVRVWAHGADDPAQFTLTATLADGTWKVSGASTSTDSVVFPSDGGATYGLGTLSLVVVTALVGLVVFCAAIALVRISGARPLHLRQ